MGLVMVTPVPSITTVLGPQVRVIFDFASILWKAPMKVADAPASTECPPFRRSMIAPPTMHDLFWATVSDSSPLLATRRPRHFSFLFPVMVSV